MALQNVLIFDFFITRLISEFEFESQVTLMLHLAEYQLSSKTC